MWLQHAICASIHHLYRTSIKQDQSVKKMQVQDKENFGLHNEGCSVVSSKCAVASFEVRMLNLLGETLCLVPAACRGGVVGMPYASMLYAGLFAMESQHRVCRGSPHKPRITNLN